MDPGRQRIAGDVKTNYTDERHMANITSNQKIVPFLWFDDKTEEAVNFYCSRFPRPEILYLVKGKVTIAKFQLGGVEFMALDGGPQFTFSPAISLFVNCETQEEVDTLWNTLSEDGEKRQCGWLQDKYGISWQIIPTALGAMMRDPDPEKSARVFQAMLQMTKIDIQALQQAYDQP
jgi:predicted 3-demethylubiquinone-9 3-methyltransferase (glyoxalase superfamily)